MLRMFAKCKISTILHGRRQDPRFSKSDRQVTYGNEYFNMGEPITGRLSSALEVERRDGRLVLVSWDSKLIFPARNPGHHLAKILPTILCYIFVHFCWRGTPFVEARPKSRCWWLPRREVPLSLKKTGLVPQPRGCKFQRDGPATLGHTCTDLEYLNC